MQWEQLSLDGLGFLQSWGTCPRMCSGKICTLIRHLNVTGKLWELDQPLERNTIYICLTKLFFTVLCTLKSCSLHIQEKINISKWEWASDVMNYLHMAPENTASKFSPFTWTSYSQSSCSNQRDLRKHGSDQVAFLLKIFASHKLKLVQMAIKTPRNQDS